MAATARENMAVAERQARFNAVLGVGPSGAGSAASSAAVFEESAKAAEMQQAKVIALRSALDPLGVAQERLNRELAEYRTLSSAGAISTQELAAAEVLAKKRFDETTTSLQRQMGVRKGLSTMQRQTLIYTASDIFASGASGMSPGMIAMQQGPQVLQAFAVEGGKASATMLRLGLVVGGVGAAVGIATAAWMSHKNALMALDAVANGTGAAIGMTGEQLNQLAVNAAKAGNVTVSAARSMTGAFAGTGKIGGDVMQKLIGLNERYAIATQQKSVAATQELAQAFADPAKGADLLNAKLGFLDGKTAAYVTTLISQNRITEAQIAMAYALDQRLASTADHVTVLGGAWSRTAKLASDAWASMGAAIDRLLGGGTRAEKLADLTRNRDNLARLPDPSSQAQVQRLNGEIQALRNQMAADTRTQQAARANTQTQAARAAINSANPIPGKLQEAQQQLAIIQAARKAGGVSDKESAVAVANLNKEIRAMAAGYSSAAAQAAALHKGSAAASKAEREAAAAARKAAREAEKDKKESIRLTDFQLQGDLKLARLAVDPRKSFSSAQNLVGKLEEEIRLRELIAGYEAGGVDAAKAKVDAQRQLGLELKAEFDARVRADQNIVDFKSTEEMVANATRLPIIYDQNADALQAMKLAGVDAFDRIGEAIVTGTTSWKSWRDVARSSIQDVIGELIRMAAINPLKNALFSGVSGYLTQPTIGKGFFSSLFGKNANGTDSWPGGLSWVGERGPELVNLPRGAQVFPNNRSMAMAASSPVINITLNAQGAGPREVDMLKAEVASLKRDLPGTIIQVSNDARQRRMIG